MRDLPQQKKKTAALQMGHQYLMCVCVCVTKIILQGQTALLGQVSYTHHQQHHQIVIIIDEEKKKKNHKS